MPVFTPLAPLLVIVLLLHPISPIHGGHVLVFPGEHSHWLNMRQIIEELVNRNHTITVLLPEASTVNYNNSHDATKFHFLVFKVPYSREDYQSMMNEFFHFSMYESYKSSPLTKFTWISYWMHSFDGLMRLQCDSMFKNEHLMATLHNAKFDAVLLDPLAPCGDLVADILGVPLIISLRFSFGSVVERHCGHMPAPASYVPASPLPYDDHMTFMERVINMATYVSASAVTELFWKMKLDYYYSKIKGSLTSVCSTLGNAEIWLIRTFWDTETPRPLPPNVKFVGGLHCKPAKPLPEDLEAFMQSSGDAGVVVATFGSMIPNLTMDRANVIATAFGRIPQKVIWRYRGETPTALAPNTKLSDWIPQNDLLGHPKTRVFVTHGGTNGLYEAVFHGVPLVGVPLFFDQPDNLARLSRLGGAVILHFNLMTADEMTEALRTVINDPRYKSSMRRLSEVHRDRPVSALDTAVFWVEFVMRHGGAQHLRLASHELNWFQYYSIDTGSFLLVILMMTAALCWVGIGYLLRKCRRQTGREKRD
ncbi:UDP-glucuronosyltransferase 2C1-like [Pholidichthys leucotaenia]